MQCCQQLLLLRFKLLHILARSFERIAIAHLRTIGQRRRAAASIVGAATIEIILCQRLDLARRSVALGIDQDYLDRWVG